MYIINQQNPGLVCRFRFRCYYTLLAIHHSQLEVRHSWFEVRYIFSPTSSMKSVTQTKELQLKPKEQ